MLSLSSPQAELIQPPEPCTQIDEEPFLLWLKIGKRAKSQQARMALS
jgi:hypothetical protein